MTETNQIYQCIKCKNIIEVLHSGAGNLKCCDSAMVRLQEKINDAGEEKHVPVIERSEKGYFIKVGSVEHPMEDAHLIQWIQLIGDGVSYKQFLNPGQKAEAEFQLHATEISARAYCNVHGLWKS